MENSLNFTLEIDAPRFSRIKVIWLLAFKLKWRWSDFRFPDVEGIPRVLVTWRHYWGCPSVGLTGCSGVVRCLKFLSRSFRLSRVSSEIWRSVGSIFKLGQVLKAASFCWRSSEFQKKRAISEQNRQRAGFRFLKGLTSEAFRSTPRGFHQPGCPSGRRSTYTAHFPCSKCICLIIWSHEENIF